MTADNRGPRWPKRVVQTFGVFHILFAVFGLYLVLGLAGFFESLDEVFKRTGSSFPYRREAYLLRTVICLTFLGAEGIAGLHLLRTRLRGVRISNVLFASMVVYFLFPWELFGPTVDRSMGATAGTGNVGITLQLVTGYPILALIALNVARRKLPDIQATEIASTENALRISSEYDQ